MVKDRRAGEHGEKVKRDELPSAFSFSRVRARIERCQGAIFTFRDVKVFTRFASPAPFLRVRHQTDFLILTVSQRG